MGVARDIPIKKGVFGVFGRAWDQKAEKCTSMAPYTYIKNV